MITALTENLGPVPRIGLAYDAWDELPTPSTPLVGAATTA
ncbi:hypothetical protein [Streptomyces sp. NPDC057780]